MKNIGSIVIQRLSLLGKAMLVPITVMPVAGLIGLLFQENMLNVSAIANVSTVVFSNVDFLFVLGAAGAYAKSKDKTTVLVAAVVAFLVFKANLAILNETLSPGVFGAIVLGVSIAITYNHTYQLKVPEILSFFANEKCVVSLSPLIGLFLSYVFSLIWWYPQAFMNEFGIWLGGMGAFGVFLFIFLNRSLIPLGLHNVLNAYILFEMGSYSTTNGEVVKGEIPRFIAGDPTAGWFWSGFYIIMIFGVPAIAYAIYKTANPENKKEIKGIMSAGALTSCTATVTEPIEFSFLFASPKLYLIHSFYTGFAGFILYLLGVRLGAFSGAGVVDYLVSFQ